MAVSKTKKKKADYTQDAIDLGLGLAGGIIANKGANFLEQQSFMQSNANIVPLIPAAVGALAYVFLPKKYKALGLGMFVVSGTEAAEPVLSELTGQMSGFMNQLGFTPQYFPGTKAESIVRTSDGIAIR